MSGMISRIFKNPEVQQQAGEAVAEQRDNSPASQGTRVVNSVQDVVNRLLGKNPQQIVTIQRSSK